ncbi:tyrosine-type recombinase/integrase, partial [Thermodesulfobacteriota bacterium]
MACIRKRRGRYVIDFYDNQGKRRWKTLPKDVRKKDANKALREIEDLLDKGIFISGREIPTFKKVAEDWILQKKVNLRASTWSVYEGHTRNHFNDLNDLKINRISTAKIEKYIASRLKEGMNILTLRKVLITLGQIMTYAVKHRYIDHNPVRDAERPHGQGKMTEKKIKVLNVKEINDFLGKVTEHKYRTLFKLAIMSGGRQGELFGLKWSDIDWKNNQVHFQRTFNNSAWYKPKTKTSDRRVDLGPGMMSDLKKWKLACPPNSLNLIFPNGAGNPIDDSSMLRRHFFPALKKAGVDRIRFHDMRHTYASLLIEQGENIKYIQNQLGQEFPFFNPNQTKSPFISI